MVIVHITLFIIILIDSCSSTLRILINICSFYNLPALKLNSTWNSTGIIYPYQEKNLSLPRSIFVDRSDDICVSFTTKGIVIVWRKNNIPSPSVYFADGSGSLFEMVVNIISKGFTLVTDIVSGLGSLVGIELGGIAVEKQKLKYFGEANSLFVASNGDIYVNNNEKSRIDRWAVDLSSISIN